MIFHLRTKFHRNETNPAKLLSYRFSRRRPVGNLLPATVLVTALFEECLHGTKFYDIHEYQYLSHTLEKFEVTSRIARQEILHPSKVICLTERVCRH